MANTISFSLEHGSLIAGRLWDDRFLRALLLSFLIEPALSQRTVPHGATGKSPASRRARILEVFTTEVALRFGRAHKTKAQKSTEAYRRLARLARGDENRLDRLLRSRPPNSYLREWSTKKVIQDSDPLRDIFSVGLYVLLLDELSRTRTVIKLEDGQKELHLQYKTGRCWVTNSDGFPKALKRLRPVAHLAAALVRLLNEQNNLSRDRTAFTTWRRHMPRYLELAKYYEDFLTVSKVTSRQSWDRHKARPRASSPVALYKREQLWCLPPLDSASLIEPMTALPSQDLKPTGAQKSSRRSSRKS